jgi:hypothetical protein
MDLLERLFEQHFHSPVEQVQPLQGELGGSGRTIIRLASADRSAIGILYDARQEDVAFLDFSRHFRRHGLPGPEIYAEDLSHSACREEDLGDTTLCEFLSSNRAGATIAPQAVEAYRQVVAMLPRFQIEAGRDLNYKVCYPRASFDRQSIAWDLNYFKYYFLRLASIPFNEQALEDDFGRLTKFLLSAPRDYFLYRDFPSRNVMWRERGPFFLDYQGGRKDALQYDIASLLYAGGAYIDFCVCALSPSHPNCSNATPAAFRCVELSARPERKQSLRALASSTTSASNSNPLRRWISSVGRGASE